jgi:hypothetical protein
MEICKDYYGDDNLWFGYDFVGCYDECITKCNTDLNSLFLEYDGNKTIVLTNEICFNSNKKDVCKIGYDKKLFYYIKVPRYGLTYKNLFSQLDNQAIENNDGKYVYGEYYQLIEFISKTTDVEYKCGRN